MARMIRRRHRTSTSIPEITLTPLIDTALTLLIIFMVTTPMIQNSIKVQLPQGSAKEVKDAAQDIVVHVDKDQTIYLNGQKISKDHLAGDLKKAVARSVQKVVFVKADERVSYGSVISLVDHIKVVGGISHVALATEKKA